jgi:peptide chain release factor 1
MSFNPYQAQIDQLAHQISESQVLLNDPEMNQLAQQDIATLTQQKQQLEQMAAEYEQSLEGSTEAVVHEHVNCIVEIRQGAGGDEAHIWANDLLRMYLRFAEKIGLKTEMIDELVIKVKSRTSQLELPPLEPGTPLTAYTIFKYESGVHRVQRVPATEAQGRIHTSTASVAVLPEVHPQAVTIREEDLDWQFTRAGGAGGQNVNKVNSAVRLTHIPTGLVVFSRQERSQSQNREVALSLIRSQVWELQEEKRLKELGDARSAIGRAQRAEKIRTYNYPQNRVTDHRINQSWHDLDAIMEGSLEEVVQGVHTFFEAEANPEATDSPSS